MSEPTPNTEPTAGEAEPRGFPFATAGASLLTLFVFLILVVLAYQSPNYLKEGTPAPPPDPAVKLEDIRAKNQALLDGAPGSGAKMSVRAATAELLEKLRTEKDRLPFPVPEPGMPQGSMPVKK